MERRTIPGETQTGVESELRKIFDRVAASDSNFKASSKTMLVRDPFEVSEDELIVKVVRRQAGVLLGQDSALLSAAGIPTVIFGPGGEGAHAVVEWVDLEQVQRCFEVLVGTVEEFCG